MFKIIKIKQYKIFRRVTIFLRESMRKLILQNIIFFYNIYYNFIGVNDKKNLIFFILLQLYPVFFFC